MKVSKNTSNIAEMVLDGMNQRGYTLTLRKVQDLLGYWMPKAETDLASENHTMHKAISEVAPMLAGRIGVKAVEIQRLLGYWNKQVAYQLREDLLQAIAVRWLERSPDEGYKAFQMARDVTVDMLRRLATRQLDSTAEEWLQDESQMFHAPVSDGVDYSDLVISKLDAGDMLAMMPDNIKRLVGKRLSGHPVVGRSAAKLTEWASEHEIDLARLLMAHNRPAIAV